MNDIGTKEVDNLRGKQVDGIGVRGAVKPFSDYPHCVGVGVRAAVDGEDEHLPVFMTIYVILRVLAGGNDKDAGT